jgi:hypothetical protein
MCELKFQIGNSGVSLLVDFGFRRRLCGFLLVYGFLFELPQQPYDLGRLVPVDLCGRSFSHHIGGQFSLISQIKPPGQVRTYRSSTVGWSR